MLARGCNGFRPHPSKSTRCGANRDTVWSTILRPLSRTRAPLARERASAFLQLYETEVKRCERSQRADKDRLFLPSRSPHGGMKGGRGAPRFHPPSSCLALGRDNGIHLLEEELLKRYLKRWLLLNGRVLRHTGC